jgi:hypothetical protein
MSVTLGTHVLLTNETKAVPLTCRECGASVQIVIPISITALMTLSNAFDNLHAHCEEEK